MQAATRRRAEAFWAGRLQCPAAWLRERGVHVAPAPEPAGLFVLAAGEAVVVLAPPDLHERLAPLAPGELLDADVLAPWLPAGTRFVGPAFVGYAESLPEPAGPVGALDAAEARRLSPLRQALSPREWQHANLERARPPWRCAEAAGSVVAAAGPQVLDDEVAHLGVATHPGHRGRGLGRRVVAAAGAAALAEGLLPQYQTLFANRAALRAGESLGFERFAVTLSARWGPPGR